MQESPQGLNSQKTAKSAAISLEEVRERIDAPPLVPKFSKAKLRGNELTVTVKVPKRTPWSLYAIPVVIFLFLTSADCETSRGIPFGAVLLLFTTIALIYLATNYFGGMGRHELFISPKGIETRRDSARRKATECHAIALRDFERSYLTKGRWNEIFEKEVGEVGDGENIRIRRAGVHFEGSAGQELTLDMTGTLTQGNLLYLLLVDPAKYEELEWVYAVVEAHLAVLIEAPPREEYMGAALPEAQERPFEMEDTQAW